MKDFWNKFTTRFAVPVLIVTQVITLYDGWESRVNQRADRELLIHCINSHLHYVGELHEVIDADGYKIMDTFTTQSTMDRWLGKVFYTYKNNKDRFVAWYEAKFRKKMLEDIRG